MGALTTHILDTRDGIPAENVRVDLFQINGDNYELIESFKTNDDGRLDQPALSGDAFKNGHYMLKFYMGDYFENRGVENAKGFLNAIPLEFHISDESSHYHVPLLASPYSYSTYRGS